MNAGGVPPNRCALIELDFMVSPDTASDCQDRYIPNQKLLINIGAGEPENLLPGR